MKILLLMMVSIAAFAAAIDEGPDRVLQKSTVYKVELEQQMHFLLDGV